MGDEKLNGALSREKQIPPLRCGMTNKKNRQQQGAKTNTGFLPFHKLRVRMTALEVI
jgi:hypothetical protein